MNKIGSFKIVRFAAILIALCCLNGVVLTQEKANPSNGPSNDEVLAGKAADELIKRYHETLDIGIVFDEMASNRAVKLLEKGKYDLGLVDRDFLMSQDANVKKRLFRNEFNYVFIFSVFQLALALNLNAEKEEDAGLPKGFYSEYNRILRKFEFVRELDYHGKDRPKIKKAVDLSRYLNELEEVIGFFKRYIPTNHFGSKVYKKNYKVAMKDRNDSAKPQTKILDGDYFFEVPDTEKVFLVIRDIFAACFVKEDGQMKLMGFILGD